MRHLIQLHFPGQLNPTKVLQDAGAVRMNPEQHRGIHATPSDEADEATAVYVYTSNSTDYYLKNPNDALDTLSGTVVYHLTANAYRQWHDTMDILMTFESDWFSTALAFGFGDMLWQMASFMVTGNPTLLHDANYFLPLMIGPIGGIVNYYVQVQHFVRCHGRSPTRNERTPLKKQSASLTVEMSLGILGWEAGLYTAFSLLNVLSLNTLETRLLFAVFTGLGQASGVLLATLENTMQTEGRLVRSTGTLIRLSVACFLSGAAWYALSSVNYAAIADLNGTPRNALNALVGGLSTLLIVTSIFASMKPKASVRSFLFCKPQCCCTLRSISPEGIGLLPYGSNTKYVT